MNKTCIEFYPVLMISNFQTLLKDMETQTAFRESRSYCHGYQMQSPKTVCLKNAVAKINHVVLDKETAIMTMNVLEI